MAYEKVCEKYKRSNKTIIPDNEFCNDVENSFVTDCIKSCSKLLKPVNFDGIDEENLFVTIVLSFLQIFINFCANRIICSGYDIGDTANEDSAKNVKNVSLFIKILESSDIRFTKPNDK